MARSTNRLAGETSPYLRQHAQNPVDWHPWGPEALERAEREDKPIFLSIGYSACHWCHVMEHESFENEAIARTLNQHFVSIKVDREERPDLDEIYMAATVAISGSGGWPMSVFLAPDQRPFFAGTYFPPNERYGRPGFATLLRKIVELWNGERAALLDQAGELTRHVLGQSSHADPLPISEQSIGRVVTELEQSFDPRFGGFGSAPKFPQAQLLALLLRHHHGTSDARALAMVQKTLDAMKNGGIYDQLGGGFARYSTDERWLVPHFEKMLYDNAQLVVIYLEAFQVTSNPEYRRIATETLDYVILEMQSPEGGYYSATDADSEGEEGKFFVFSREQIDQVLSPELAEAFCLHYDITPEGNWEGKNVLNTPRPIQKSAEELGLSLEQLQDQLADSRRQLYRARAERIPPQLDDKVLTSWNGLLIAAMADGHRILRDPRYLESARRAADFLLSKLQTDQGRLLRTLRGDRAPVPAFLEDYAFLADGLISLFETSGERRWLDSALALAERAVRDFGEPGGAFFNTAHDHESLIARTRTGHDGALPNPNAILARVLVRLAQHLDRPELLTRAVAAITGYGQAIERAPRAFATTLNLVDWLLETPVELVVAGDPNSPDTEALTAALARHYLPNRIQALALPSEAPTPLTRGKSPIDPKPTLYVCQNFTCQAPITEIERIESALASDRRDRVRVARIGKSEQTAKNL